MHQWSSFSRLVILAYQNEEQRHWITKRNGGKKPKWNGRVGWNILFLEKLILRYLSKQSLYFLWLLYHMALAWFSGISWGPPRSGPGLVIGFTKQNKKHRAPACCSKIISQGKQTTVRPQGGEAHFPLAGGTALTCCRMQSPYAGNDSQKHSILADSASFQKLHPLGCRVRKWLWTGYSRVFSLCSEVERTACKRKPQMVLD